MPLYVVGLNHRSAPIEVRERLSFANDAQRQALDDLKRATAADEVALLSTCNRTEIFLRGEEGVVQRARDWLAATPAAQGLPLDDYLYRLQDAEAARHTFRVASGLDSMVLGEPQILGQVKLSVKMAGEAATLGGPLNRLFQETFKVAKEVRSDTAIGATSVSMTAAAAKLARQLFGDLSETRLLLIGAGEMIELAATHFTAVKPKTVAVANRTLERGRELAEKLNGQALTLQQLPERIHEFDIVISCTASTLPLIGKGMIERALKLRKHRPMFMVDLAVPRDIEAEVGELDDVFLYSLDSLGRVIEQNLEARGAEVGAAEEIVSRHTEEFMRWLSSRTAVPVIQQLRGKAEQYRQTELERARKSLAKGEDPATVLEQLANGLTNKFLHHPLSALQRVSGAESQALAEAIERLYPNTEE